MSTPSKVDLLLNLIDSMQSTLNFKYSRAFMQEVAAEIRALQALCAPPAPRLREYKGVVYQNDVWLARQSGRGYESVSALIAVNQHDFNDADHAPLYALKQAPFEPVETVEHVLTNFYAVAQSRDVEFAVREYTPRLRAAVLGEPPRAVPPEPACIADLRHWGGSGLVSTSDFDEGAVNREAVLAAYDALAASVAR